MQSLIFIVLLVSSLPLAFAAPSFASTDIRPNQVDKRATGTITTDVTATPLPAAGEYISPIQIDGKTYNVLLDTGSNSLWIKGSGSGNPFNLTYGSTSTNTISGNIAYGNVTLGNIVLTNQAYGLANKGTDNYLYDGILGLGSSPTSFGSQNPSVPSWMSRAMPLLQQPLFGVKLVRGGAGVFNFGYANTAYENSSPLNISSDTSAGKWPIAVTSFGVSSGDIPASCILDTGTTYSYIPDSAAQGYWNATGWAGNEDSTGTWHFPCSNTPPTFNPRAGGSNLPTPGSLLKTGSSQCRSTLGGTFKGCIFGQNFLYGQYAIFDWGNRRVGLTIQK